MVDLNLKFALKDDIKSLPIYNYKDEIIRFVKNKDNTYDANRLILVGETGCGKTTQVPKIIHEFNKELKICVTQPRRVAAISVALRVSHELNSKIGDTVGYSVRFDERSSINTKIKYVTDGMLLRELILDVNLEKYDIIILDEIHERSLNSDLLIALITNIQIKRPELKLITMSATIDTNKLTKYLDTKSLIRVSGRSFPIEIYNICEKEKNYIDATCTTIMQIHLLETDKNFINGDILVFLPGQEDIEDLHQLLDSKNLMIKENHKKLAIFELFSNMPNIEQMKVFKPINSEKYRKVILATNIAETSITIKNVKFVIDSGLFKTRIYDPIKAIDSLIISNIYKSSAIQRSGRAGRESSGKCYRLYTEEEYNSLRENSIPEILRINLKSFILFLKVLDQEVDKLNFLDKPEKVNYLKAFEDLKLIKALDYDGNLTDIGKKMSILPVEPMQAKILINAFLIDEYKLIVEDIITIISLLQTDSIFYAPSKEKEKAEMARVKFTNNSSDHITLLNVFNQWKEYLKDNEKNIIKLDENKKEMTTKNLSENWCKEYYVNEKSLLKADEIKKQLKRYLNKMFDDNNIVKNIELENVLIEKKNFLYEDRKKLNSTKEDLIIKCLTSGFISNIAKYDKDNVFLTNYGKHCCRLHPSSNLFKNLKVVKEKGFIIFTEIVTTSKMFLKICSVVDKSIVNSMSLWSNDFNKQ